MSLFWDIYCYFYTLSLKIWFPYRKLVVDILDKLTISSGDYILDAGCGPGNLILEIIKQNKNNLKIVGLDSSLHMLKYARSRFKKMKNIIIQSADLNYKLDFPDGYFNKIVCNNVLYSLINPAKTIEEFYRLLNSGGTLIVSNPKPDARPKALFQAQLKSLFEIRPYYLCIFYILIFIFYLPFGLIVMFMNVVIVKKVRSGSFHFLSQEELSSMIRSAGFQNIEFSETYAGQNFLITVRKFSHN